MHISQILSKIKQIHPDKLPGFMAQSKMSPPNRKKFNKEELKKFEAKESAVLILLYEKNGESYIVFTQRHEYKGAHSGQISLPGGKRDPEDEDLQSTALREAKEEVGAILNKKDILLELTWLYVPPSNFVIYPFLAYTEKEANFIKEEREVKEILEFKVEDLLNKDNQKVFLYHNEKLNIQFESPSFQIEGKTIWGATAMIISELLSILEA
ncbi:MAG: CoA pyrophosphatase [Chitinophagales bacterium]|nr:CoA pyrophosphatase [Chitinophagales bacterium]